MVVFLKYSISFKDLTGLYHPNYLTTLYLGYECVLVSVAKERIKRKLPTGSVTVHVIGKNLNCLEGIL